MSGRVPAGEILNEAFQFGFYRWLTVFRFAWAPLALTAIMMWALVGYIFDKDALEGIERASDLNSFSDILNVSPFTAFAVGVLAAIILMVVFAGMFASIYRLVALGEDRPGILQVRFDGPAQRVFVAQLILNGINYAIMIAAILLGLALGGASLGDLGNAGREFFALVQQSARDPSFQPSEADLANLASPLGGVMLGSLIAAPLLVFVNVRLSPFLSGSAAENRLLLFGAFHLTAGSFWAIFVVYLLFILALFAIGLAFSLAMSFIELMSSLGGSMAFIGAIFGVIGFAATLAYQVFVIGVQLSVQAIIYRRLKTGE